VKWFIFFLLIICISGVVSASNSTNYGLEILVSPGMQSNSSNFTTNMAIEPIIGSGGSPNYQICLGFFCRIVPFPAVILAIGIALLGSMLFFAGWARKSEHIPIQILFMFCVLLLGITAIYVMSNYYDIFSINIGLFAVLIFIIAFFIITIFLDKKLYKVKESY
jgi:hypothetical protein